MITNSQGKPVSLAGSWGPRTDKGGPSQPRESMYCACSTKAFSMDAMDVLNRRFGQDSIRLLSLESFCVPGAARIFDHSVH